MTVPGAPQRPSARRRPALELRSIRRAEGGVSRLPPRLPTTSGVRARVERSTRGSADVRDELAFLLHDARNLLSVIETNVEVLRGEVSRGLDPVVDDVASATARLHTMLESALAGGGAREAPGGVVRRLARVSDIVRTATLGLRRPPRGVRLEVVALGEDFVEVDDARIARMLSNLVENAVRFSPDGGLVRVRAEVGAATLALTVADEGRGVPPSLREAIFRPSPAGSLHGLGLAFCRRVALEHGGTLELSPSERGACFVVVLPSHP